MAVWTAWGNVGNVGGLVKLPTAAGPQVTQTAELYSKANSEMEANIKEMGGKAEALQEVVDAADEVMTAAKNSLGTSAVVETLLGLEDSRDEDIDFQGICKTLQDTADQMQQQHISIPPSLMMRFRQQLAKFSDID